MMASIAPTDLDSTVVAPSVRVRYFARLRESFGLDGEVVDASLAPSLQALLTVLRGRHGERADTLLSPRIRVAVDGEIIGQGVDLPLRADAEVAFLPPVTGG